MNASPLFIKVKLIGGGLKSDVRYAHLDLMQVVALVEREVEGQPALEMVLLGGYSVVAWDEERSGVNEVTKMKQRFVEQAMSPQLVVPSRMPVVSH